MKGPLKGAEMQIFKNLCGKNQVCKSIGVTCSTYRRFTKDKVENYETKMRRKKELLLQKKGKKNIGKAGKILEEENSRQIKAGKSSRLCYFWFQS